jgi:hypothetical protein
MGGVGGQIPGGMSVPYGPPPPNQFMTQKPKSRAIKIVDPNTHEELKIDPVKKESADTAPPSGLGSAVRGSSNGLIQPRAPVGYNPSHHMGPSSMYYYAPVFQQGLPKAGGFSGAPLSSSPPVRYGPFNTGHSGQGVTFGHSGTTPVPPGPKVAPQLGAVPPLGSANPGPSPVEMLSTPPVAPLIPVMVGPSPVTVQGIPAVINPRAIPPPVGMNPPIISNGRPPSLTVPPVSPPAPLTPSSVLPSPNAPNASVAFKFGDVEASGSTPVASSEASSEGSSNGANGHASTGVESVNASVGPQYVLTSPGASGPVMNRPSVTVAPPKQVTGSSNASGVSPKMMTPPGTGGAGTFGEKKVEAGKTSGNPNSRKGSKKDRQRQQQQQQQQQQQPYLASLQVPESERNSDQLVSPAGQSSMDRTPSAGSGVPGGLKLGLQRTQSGAHGSTAVYTPVKSKSEESKVGNAKAGSKVPHQGRHGLSQGSGLI